MARVSFSDRVRRVGVALLWLVLFAGVGVGVTILLSNLVPGLGGRAWWLARNGLYQLAGFLCATWLVGRVANGYSWERMGWRTPHRRLPRHFLRGVIVGVAMAGAAILLAVVADDAAVRLTGTAGFAAVAGPLAIGLLAAALSEELVFRGYPLRRLADALGPGVAVALLALAFGAAHLSNPDAGVVSTANIALAAVWLAAAFFSSGGIALAWGLHFGWNAGLSLLFDAPVSGLAFGIPGVDYVPGAHAWIDGGAFGPEGGIIGTLVMAAGVALVLGRSARAPRRWLAEVA
jgi:membrane protease YdiL (CAAX protease family)